MTNVTAENVTCPIDRAVDVCPHCQHAVSPKFISATLNGKLGGRGAFLDIAYKCTRHSCSRLFIGVYKRTTSQGENMVRDFKLQKAYPINQIPPSIPEEVKKISTAFESIYTQAAAAEALGLDEIAGVGYRKALEFLIKDYCIHKNENDTDQIKKSFLGVVIDNYVDDANIKACAKRAAWLGNDETHYIKKWEDKDINDLKILVQLTSGWVTNNILTEKYMAEMA